MGDNKLVLVESPFRGKDYSETTRNIYYAKLCLRDSFFRGEDPLASHLLYAQTGILDDTIEDERNRGIHAGLAWGENATLSAFYIDFGWSAGMKDHGLKRAKELGRKFEERSLGTPKKVLKMIEGMSKKEPFIPTGILF